MFDALENEMAAINNNLSILPTKTKKNKVDYNNYIDSFITDFSSRLNNVKAEMERRYTLLNKKYSSSPDLVFDSEFDINYIKCSDNSFDCSSKMNLDYYLYQLSHYNGDLDKVNEIILIIINKFNEVGVLLKASDFNYTDYVYDYINALLNNGNVLEVFENIYWQNSDLIKHIELNFRFLYLKYFKKIKKYYDNLKFSSNSLNDYISSKDSYLDNQHKNIKYIYSMFSNGTLSLSDYSKKSLEALSSEFIINSNDSNYSYLLKLKDSLLEYRSLLKFMYIIDDMKELYSKKNEYKDLYNNKLKEIVKNEKQLFKLNKKLHSSFSKKNYAQIRLSVINSVNELYDMYKELNSLKVKDSIYKLITDDSSYLDLFKIVTRDFNYFVSLLSVQDIDLIMSDIDSNILSLFKFVYGFSHNIINNISILDSRDIPLMISDRYRLCNINVPSDISKDSIDTLIKKINNLIIGFDLDLNDMKYDELYFLLYYLKLGK